MKTRGILLGAMMGLSLARASAVEPTEGSGALEVIYEPKQCITDPCPQYKVIAMNGEAVKNPMGADLLNIEDKKIPVDRAALVMGTWVREDQYLKVTVKEWILHVREKVEPKKETPEKR